MQDEPKLFSREPILITLLATTSIQLADEARVVDMKLVRTDAYNWALSMGMKLVNSAMNPLSGG